MRTSPRNPRSNPIFLAALLIAGCGDDSESTEGTQTTTTESTTTDPGSGTETTDGPSATEGAGEESSGEGSTGASSAALTAEEVAPIAERYANLVFENYSDALESARGLRDALYAFTADPSEDTLAAAKEAWFAARVPYGQTESYRFYGGPIDDDETGPEGQLNAWPMDEGYVDYVEGFENSGIINDPKIEITAETLAGLNEQGGEENVATGYHAIEFLLWGQDLSDDGPGARPFTDFVDDGTAANWGRRRQYLEVVADLLIADLQAVTNTWDPELTENYRTSFVDLAPGEIVQNIMRGIGALSGAELAEERINVALETKLQEDEHSCFSDNTHNDMLFNFLAVKNVYLGEYGDSSGPGIYDLIAARDQTLADAITAKLEALDTMIRAVEPPFDQIIVAEDDDPRRLAVVDIVTELRDTSDMLVEGAALMDITLNTALE